ncbi:hypothetical protein SARC_08363 [Sphaeroforma arctica JP610]|uniref:Uncharacterized protein n=1 Tax=Sphaeroforma arctica JP610 TaxID=667725 RepID=A0A0L0FRC5_9EUKA|nr:hypothetical protein SARC_08363 [Sphaeroforma arctica JP610]KNC79239.1 hypothetical protein SARC_08363 [Sphaeroforma arctica JP610]|eukprot:XP_014153141.1 hypothetical protein SARC_08363 [Sphaeroforma arctica JP610]
MFVSRATFWSVVSIATCSTYAYEYEVTSCADMASYDAGVQQVRMQWNAAWRYTDDCRKLDYVKSQVNKACPRTPECLVDGFLDGLEDKYEERKMKCGCECSEETPAVTSSPVVSPTPACDGTGRSSANKKWDAALEVYGSTCGMLDTVLEVANFQCPSKKCGREEYNARVAELYNIDLRKCTEQCKGYGFAHGNRLAMSFCGTTALSTALGDEKLTISICNQEEQKKCEEQLEQYVYSMCDEARDSTAGAEYYDALRKSCAITIGPDHPIPTTKPFPNDNYMTCEMWHNESVDNNCDDLDGKYLDQETGCCRKLYRCGPWPKCTALECCTLLDY